MDHGIMILSSELVAQSDALIVGVLLSHGSHMTVMIPVRRMRRVLVSAMLIDMGMLVVVRLPVGTKIKGSRRVIEIHYPACCLECIPSRFTDSQVYCVNSCIVAEYPAMCKSVRRSVDRLLIMPAAV